MTASISILILIFVIIGALMLYYAYEIGIKKDMKVIHEYHYLNVKQNDQDRYLIAMAMGAFVIGVSLLVQAIIIYIYKSFYLYILFIGLFAGLGIMIYAQYKYNGNMFS